MTLGPRRGTGDGKVVEMMYVWLLVPKDALLLCPAGLHINKQSALDHRKSKNKTFYENTGDNDVLVDGDDHDNKTTDQHNEHE